MCHSLHASKSFVGNDKVEPRGEADAPEHTKWVVGEGYVGIERCSDDAILEVGEATEGVDEVAE